MNKKSGLLSAVLLSALSTVAMSADVREATQPDPSVMLDMENHFAAQDKAGTKKIDFSAFLVLAKEVEPYRAKRLLSLDDFLAMAEKPNTIILDSRSSEAFERKHLKGALNLNFADYNQISLYQLIPDKNTVILIYCNNNFFNDQSNFPTKAAFSLPEVGLNRNPVDNDKLGLALNIPTYINLYGYGYRNIYELRDTVSVNHPGLTFEGNEMNRLPARLLLP